MQNHTVYSFCINTVNDHQIRNIILILQHFLMLRKNKSAQNNYKCTLPLAGKSSICYCRMAIFFVSFIFSAFPRML